MNDCWPFTSHKFNHRCSLFLVWLSNRLEIPKTFMFEERLFNQQNRERNPWANFAHSIQAWRIEIEWSEDEERWTFSRNFAHMIGMWRRQIVLNIFFFLELIVVWGCILLEEHSDSLESEALLLKEQFYMTEKEWRSRKRSTVQYMLWCIMG